MADDLKQLNVHVPTEFIDEKVDAFRTRYGWSRRDLVMTAIETLEQVMDAHEEFADQYDSDIGEVYMRLAAQMPAGFVEVPKEGVTPARAAGMPAVRVDSWIVFRDPETGNLMAEEEGGERRIGIVDDGEIKPLRMPSAAKVALN